MGLFDNLGGLKGMLGTIAAAEGPALVSAVLAKTNLGGLNGIVAQLQQGGLGSQVQTWLGSGANAQVSIDQIREALGDQHVQQIASQLGVPVDQALKFLTEHLPAAVDQASPNGTLEPNA
jgi:uncharacterized protein YidB (DUF937 family)